jgi:hypothetical protein
MHLPFHASNGITALQQHVLRTILYYDVFNYPLRAEEVFQFLGTNSVVQQDVARALDDLSDLQCIYRYNPFYCARPIPSFVERRNKGNALAAKLLPRAQKRANLIARFPFVRGVFASGSMAKGYMEEASDIDFFIITSRGRLWIARTLLVLYKRLFLSNSHKYFCVNYFVTEDHVEIDDKNIFTATELATVLPLYGKCQYESLIASNAWIRDRFPNFKPRDVNAVRDGVATGFKKVIEGLLSLVMVDRLEHFCMSITRRRWRRLYKHDYTPEDFDVAFRSTTYASKNHPQHFQRKVITVYNEKLLSHNLQMIDHEAIHASENRGEIGAV